MTSEMTGAALRLLIVLPLVAAMAYFFIKYGLARRSRAVGGQRRMRIIEQLSIGPKAFLTLVEVGGSYILLAQDEKGVSILEHMDDLPAPVVPEDKELNWQGIISAASRGANTLGARMAKYITTQESGVRSRKSEWGSRRK